MNGFTGNYFFSPTETSPGVFICNRSTAQPFANRVCNSASTSSYTYSFSVWIQSYAPTNNTSYSMNTGTCVKPNYSLTAVKHSILYGADDNGCPTSGTLHSDNQNETDNFQPILWPEAEIRPLSSCTQFTYSSAQYNGADCEVKITREISEQRGTQSANGVSIINRTREISIFTGLTYMQGNSSANGTDPGRDGYTPTECGSNGTLADPCPQGQSRNELGQCVTPPPQCTPPQVLNPEGTACIDPPPEPPQCTPPQVLNPEGTACIDPSDPGTGGTGGTGGDTGGTGGDTGGTGGTGGTGDTGGTGGTGGDTGGTGGTGGDTGTGSGECDPTASNYMTCLLGGGTTYAPGGIVASGAGVPDAQLIATQQEIDAKVSDLKLLFSGDNFGSSGGNLPCFDPIEFNGKYTQICLSDYQQQLEIIPPVLVLIAALIGAFIIFS